MYFILNHFVLNEFFAMFIFLSDASIPVTSAPILHIGSDKSPPPHPTSKIFIFSSGFFVFSVF